MRAGELTSGRISGGRLTGILGALAVLYALFLIYLLIAPLARFTGVVSGVVALTYYRLSYYGAPVDLESLDAVRVISLLLVAEAAFMLLTGICMIACRNQRLIRELALSASLIAVMYIPIYIGLLRIVDVEVASLAVSNTWVTSAGIVDFGHTVTSASPLLKTRHLPLIVTGVYSSVLFAYVVYVERKLQNKPAQ